MEAINEFLSKNVGIITIVLSGIIFLLGYLNFKGKQAVQVFVEKVKEHVGDDGKIDLEELKDIIDSVWGAVFPKKQSPDAQSPEKPAA